MMKNGLIKVDLFKLIVLVLLIILLIILLCEKPGASISNKTMDTADTQPPTESSTARENRPVQIPLLPIAGDSLQLNEEYTGLLDAGGVLRYQLSEDGKKWLPLIPESVLAALPDDFKLIMDESLMWHILDGNGDVLYSFNYESLSWEMFSGESTETQDAISQGNNGIDVCEGANPARLISVGSHVTVVNALIPLRSSPDAETDNYLLPLHEGTTLEIIMLPVCTPYLDGANLWWGVRTEDGSEGWAAESSAISDVYYLQEIE